MVLVFCPLFPVSRIMTFASCMAWLVARGSSWLVVVVLAARGSWLVVALIMYVVSVYVLP